MACGPPCTQWSPHPCSSKPSASPPEAQRPAQMGRMELFRARPRCFQVAGPHIGRPRGRISFLMPVCVLQKASGEGYSP